MRGGEDALPHQRFAIRQLDRRRCSTPTTGMRDLLSRSHEVVESDIAIGRPGIRYAIGTIHRCEITIVLVFVVFVFVFVVDINKEAVACDFLLIGFGSIAL